MKNQQHKTRSHLVSGKGCFKWISFLVRNMVCVCDISQAMGVLLNTGPPLYHIDKVLCIVVYEFRAFVNLIPVARH